MRRNIEIPAGAGTGKNAKIDDRELLPNLLIKGAEAEVLKQYSDYQLDRSNEKFKLLSGVETSWKELMEAHLKFKRFIANKKREYIKTFPDEIYDEWRRLNKWDQRPYSKHHKPRIFSFYTKIFIYGRFPMEILPTLEKLNDYIYPGIRLFKHFELLGDESYSDLKGFITDAIAVAKSCNDMYECRVKYAAKFGVPFQLSVFRDNDGILKSI